jgi:autotransporter-associated beta strand protein
MKPVFCICSKILLVKPILLFFLFSQLCPNLSFSATYTWNGSVSSAWNVNANWTPATGFPIAGDIVNISNAAAPNMCVLDINRTVATLNVSAGALDLNGLTLTLSTGISGTGGVIQNGSISTVNISALSSTTFNGTVAITKTGGGDNTLAGGNTFNGPFTISNSDNS